MGRKRKKRRSRGDDFGMGALSSATKRGLWILVLFGLVLLLAFSLLGYAGLFGEYIDASLAVAFGWTRVGVPIVLLAVIYYLIKRELFHVPATKYWGLLLLFLGAAGLFHSFIPPDQMQFQAAEGSGGGYLGFIVAMLLQRYFGFWLEVFIVFAMLFAGILIFFNLPLSALFIGREDRPGWLARMWHRWQEEKEAVIAEEEDAEDEEDYEEEEEPEEEEPEEEEEYEEPEEEPAQEPEDEGEQDDEEDEEEIVVKKVTRRRRIKIPIDLLDQRDSKVNSGNTEHNREIIRKTLENFNIDVDMGDINVGPTVTQYTLKPAQGIKLTKILSLSNDLALALAAHPIRIEAPIPGKSLIGIEVPNKASALICLRDLISGREMKKAKKKGDLLIPLGVDVSGKPFIIALEKLPHMLIAGATGSGKSVAINSMILSLLYQHGPDDLKFIMVDPKRVELPVYNRIPHLLTPVITDVKKTVNALKWLIAEMERRYETLSAKGKRNIASYNASAEEPLPYIVLVIDELADLMLAAGAEIETHIIRLAQMARAVGIHLVLATQRPSVDVITGLLKANIPGRVAFSVASVVDSRTILDSLGAEKLVGRGDMLYSSAEVSKPKRLQGAFVDEHEVKRVVRFLVDEVGEPDYLDEVVDKQQTPTAFKAGDDHGDELYEEAKEIVVAAEKASTSYLQRKLRIGYARAARLMDILEEAGIVGPQDGSRAREVLISADEDDMIEEEETPDFSDDNEEEGAEYEDEEENVEYEDEEEKEEGSEYEDEEEEGEE